MKVTATELPGVLILEPQVIGDERGFFLETFQEERYRQAAGISLAFVQDNHSRSRRGVLRGLHAQRPHPQGKLILQLHLSWAPSEEEAVDIARTQWGSNCLTPPTTWDLARPSDFEEATREVSEEKLRSTVQVSSDLAVHAQRIREFADLGFDELYLHLVGTEQKPFIEAFAEHVLPEVR